MVDPNSPYGLTEREHEIALLAGQLTNPEIADRLNISPRTVKTHVAHVLQKLKVSGREKISAALEVASPLIAYLDSSAQRTIRGHLDSLRVDGDPDTQLSSAKLAVMHLSVPLQQFVMEVLGPLRREGDAHARQVRRGVVVFAIAEIREETLARLSDTVLPSVDGLTIVLDEPMHQQLHLRSGLLYSLFTEVEVNDQKLYAHAGPTPAAHPVANSHGFAPAPLTDNGALFALTDFDAHIHRFRRSLGNCTELKLRLEAALCLNDQVVVFAPELARLPEAGDAVEEYETFLRRGEIVILRPTKLAEPGDLRTGLISYFQEQGNEYWESGEGERDLTSLSVPFENTDGFQCAVRLLEQCPIPLQRGYSATRRFYRALEWDLREGASLYVGDFSSGMLEQGDFSLWQLITLHRVVDGRAAPILDAEVVDQVLADLRGRVLRAGPPGRRSMSRLIALALVKRGAGENPSPEAGRLLQSIEARLHRLYVRSQFNSNPGFEVDPRHDWTDPYYENYFYDHLEHLARGEVEVPLGPTRVAKLREERNWWPFVAYHLATVRAALRRRALTGEDLDAQLQELWHRDSDTAYDVLRDVLVGGQ